MFEMPLLKIKSKIIGFAIFLVALFFYGVLLWSYRDQVPITITISSILVMGISSLLVTLMVWLGGIIWLLLLRDYKIAIAPVSIFCVYAITQFGKYLPGNVGHFASRVVMAKVIGIPLAITLSSMLIEQLWAASVGFSLALLSQLLFLDSNLMRIDLGFGPIQFGIAAAFLITIPWFGIIFLNRYLPKLANRLCGGGSIILPPLRTALAVSALFLLGFLIMGIILKIQAQSLFGVTEGSVFELTCLFAVAWLAGYLVPGAPGGLGIREAMMVLVFSPVLGAGAAVGLGITLRVTTTVGDAMALILGIIGRRYLMRPTLIRKSIRGIQEDQKNHP